MDAIALLKKIRLFIINHAEQLIVCQESKAKKNSTSELVVE